MSPYLADMQMDMLTTTSEKIKDIIDGYVEVTDLTGEKFQALQWRAKNYLITIRDKDDYKELREKATSGGSLPLAIKSKVDIGLEFDLKILC